MPLIAGQVGLQAQIITSWTNVLTNTAALAAADLGTAVIAFAQTGIPMTVDTVTLAPGQGILGAVTTTPGVVTGTGEGGLDVPVAGMGLSSAKALFINALVAAWSNVTIANTVVLSATNVSMAYLNFLSQAKVMSIVTAVSPPGQAAPPPVGPLAPGPWAGVGVGGLESPVGAGLATGLAAFVSSVVAAWSNVTISNTPLITATAIADASLALFTLASISTTDLGTAGGGLCVVGVPPADPSMSGSTVGPSPGSGTGTGALL